LTSPIFSICFEQAKHEHAIEELNESAFGPGRFTRTAYRLREGVPHEPALSFVALIASESMDDNPIGSVRQSRVAISGSEALILGPLVVSPRHKNIGIGRELMHRTIEAARDHEHALIILVGDLAYYEKFGFARIPARQITLPGPVDPERLLYLELQSGALEKRQGMANRHVQTCDSTR
jgi:predicted N-acetyltransferase YhbS